MKLGEPSISGPAVLTFTRLISMEAHSLVGPNVHINESDAGSQVVAVNLEELH